ncbi:hypothetical protein HG536_0C03850 [Torulaspora globosa]|uniref:Pre-mRNA-splicing factor 18 n=1 Tax=Torulaspora globosa TaxID=48254 RepID=A0A7G3ZFD0_9SACH|nr:uncharacterized protein HG536_0C03850 [Torulaspora globosa]QLL32216.1 hypothetical protein HG536_0C03850 [Torulaspora globosa]
MSLDLASLLKNEIAKKQEELQKPAAEKPRPESPPPQRKEHVEGKEQEDHADESEGGVSIEQQIERLKSRPQRVENILAGDAKVARKIDPRDIGDPAKLKRLSLQCNLFIHDILSQWDTHSEEYNSELLLETKKALFPLLVKLRRATLSDDLVISLASVLYHLQQPNQNNLAIESYMKLSIGNVAWPIGVTSVGIHARSAHSKIQGSDGQVANVMVDEITRLWITSIKRLITFHEWLSRT